MDATSRGRIAACGMMSYNGTRLLREILLDAIDTIAMYLELHTKHDLITRDISVTIIVTVTC